MTKIFDGKEDEQIGPISETTFTDILAKSKSNLNHQKHYLDWYVEWNGSNKNYGFALRALLVKPDASEEVIARVDLQVNDAGEWSSWKGQDTHVVDQDGQYTFKLQVAVENSNLDFYARRRRVTVEQE